MDSAIKYGGQNRGQNCATACYTTHQAVVSVCVGIGLLNTVSQMRFQNADNSYVYQYQLKCEDRNDHLQSVRISIADVHVLVWNVDECIFTMTSNLSNPCVCLSILLRYIVLELCISKNVHM